MHLFQKSDALSEQRHDLSLVSLIICWLAFAFLFQQVVLSEDAVEEKPLATCAVQEIAAQNNDSAMPANVVVNRYQTPQADPLSNYSRAGDGQWLIPAQVDRTNSLLRLMVLGPQQPTLVDVSISMEGKPFSAAREELIDSLLEHATVESLVREAVSVPVPDPAEKSSETAADRNKEDEAKEDKAKEDVKPEDGSVALEKDSAEDAAAAEEKDGTKNKKKADKPVVDVQQRMARTVAQRLVNYMASSDVKADREEVRWLLAEWTGGPAVLTMGPAMNWQRVGFAPLWNAIDVDNDQSLSSAEIAAAPERLKQVDVDENSIVELNELFAVGEQNATAPHGYPLIVIIDRETNWHELNSYLQAAYGRRAAEQQGQVASNTSALLTRIASGDPALKPVDLESLVDEPALIRLRISLGDEKNEVALLAANDQEYSESDNLVTVAQSDMYLEFSAGELKEKEASEPAATQIAIGAVVDGYPLFRLLDHNEDRRLSPRECRNLPKLLTTLDLNEDGQIDSHEKPTAIRIAITRGPHAHEMLAEPTSAPRRFIPDDETAANQSLSKEPTKSAPAWFTDMDRNRDGDVSRSEFLGTSEQFKQLDQDGDGLLGEQEVAE